MCRTIYRYDGTGADENRNASDYQLNGANWCMRSEALRSGWKEMDY